jgi:hypothetical protein
LYIKYHTSDQSIIFRLHAFHFSKFADLLNEVCKNLKRFLIPTQMLHYYKKMYLLIGLDYSHIFFHFRYVYVECKIKFWSVCERIIKVDHHIITAKPLP